jgi:hypothetical protein
MKRAHAIAAALALVGWYLMVPPLYQQTEGKWKLDLHAAINEWQLVDSYDSADACKQGLSDHLRVMRQGTFANPAEKPDAIFQLQTGQCIATDDPRLKDKAR